MEIKGCPSQQAEGPLGQKAKVAAVKMKKSIQKKKSMIKRKWTMRPNVLRIA